MYRILDNVISVKNDPFSWEELNCFYRAFAVSFNAFNEKFFNRFLALISYYIVWEIDDIRAFTFNSDDIIIEIYNKELSALFGAEIELNKFYSMNSMVKEIQKRLNAEEVVILPGDLSEISYCNYYKEKHHGHYFIIKGYDDRKQIFYVLDNLQNDQGNSTNYTDFIIDYKVLYKACKTFKDYFDPAISKKFFWSIRKNCDNKTTMNYKECILKLLDRIEKKNRDGVSLENKKWLTDNVSVEKNFLLQNYLKMANIRKLFYDSLILSIDDMGIEHDLGNIQQTVIKGWENFKYKIIYNFQTNKDLGTLYDEKQKKCLEKELEFILEFKNVIRNNDKAGIEDFEKEQKNYFIQNKRNARYKINDNVFSVNIDEKDIYDTWKNIDNSCQLLYYVNDKEITFNTDMKLEVNHGNPSFSGITIVMENGYRYNFGVLGGINLCIHEISDAPMYELYMKECIVLDSIQLKILIENDKIYFSYDLGAKEHENILTVNSQLKVKYIGLMVRTWEHCKVNSCFSNIPNSLI